MPRGRPRATERPAPKNDLADALVGIVHEGQALRRALRGRGIVLAKEATKTLGRVVDALGDL